MAAIRCTHARGGLLALLLALASAGALAQARVADGLLTDEAGLTLYVFDNDLTVPGRSACINACLHMWTPFYAAPDAVPAGEHTLISRDDGRRQWAYKGRPLYRWYDDRRPGERGGDGLRQVWHAAVP